MKTAEVSSWLSTEDLELKPLRARNALNEQPPSRAIETFVGVAAAVNILRSPTIRDAGNRTRRFIEGQNAHTGPAELRSCPRDGDVPAAIAIKARSYDIARRGDSEALNDSDLTVAVCRWLLHWANRRLPIPLEYARANRHRVADGRIPSRP